LKTIRQSIAGNKLNKACTQKPKNNTKHAYLTLADKSKATSKPWFSRLQRHSRIYSETQNIHKHVLNCSGTHTQQRRKNLWIWLYYII